MNRDQNRIKIFRERVLQISLGSLLYLIKTSQMNAQFFERQSAFSLLCGMHSVNNLLARPEYTKQQMNDICYKLSDAFINPHKHLFGGDYDANVVIIALQDQHCVAKWQDRRNQFTLKEQINEQGQQMQLIGYIINKFQGEGILNKIFRFSPRHWIALRKQGDNYRLLDSNEESTQTYSKNQAQQLINDLVAGNNAGEQSNEVIAVYKPR